MTCHACGKNLPDGAKFCNSCGAAITAGEPAPQQRRNTKPLLIILIVLASLIIFLMLCGFGLFALLRMFFANKPVIEFPEPAIVETAPSVELPAEAPTENTAPVVYPYMEFASPIIPISSERYLTADDLQYATGTKLMLARSEIYARHGVIFADSELLSYFEHQSWYQPSVAEDAFDEDQLNDQESANIELIEVFEKIAQGDYAPSADNPYMRYYDPYTEILMPKSSNTKLTLADLCDYTKEELIIVRNQIIALHGYTFRDQHLMEYFLQCSWYKPYYVPGRSDLVQGMTTVEFENMDFIHQHENNPPTSNYLDALDTRLDYRIDTEFYSLYLPNYWKEYAVYNSNDQFNCGFSEKPDSENPNNYYPGRLFTIMVMPLDAYHDFPVCINMGIISNGVNTYRLVVLFPSDIQFSFENQALYSKMDSEIDAILDTLTLQNGYAFTE